MTALPYSVEPLAQKTLGLIVLQSDETIEQDFRRLMPQQINLHVSRVPSGLDVTADSLQAMQDHLPAASALLPQTLQFDAIGYGCTSGTSQIGVQRIADLVGSGAQTAHVSEPVSALRAACGALGVSRLAILSPYIQEVSQHLRDVLAEGGIETPVFGSFEEAQEERVVRIDPASVFDGAVQLAAQGDIEAVFLSCTNLRTLDVIADLEQEIGLPVLSSNQVLAWHLARLAGVRLQRSELGRLGQI